MSQRPLLPACPAANSPFLLLPGGSALVLPWAAQEPEGADPHPAWGRGMPGLREAHALHVTGQKGY